LIVGEAVASHRAIFRQSVAGGYQTWQLSAHGRQGSIGPPALPAVG
jgi:hypothetical protein